MARRYQIWQHSTNLRWFVDDGTSPAATAAGGYETDEQAAASARDLIATRGDDGEIVMTIAQAVQIVPDPPLMDRRGRPLYRMIASVPNPLRDRRCRHGDGAIESFEPGWILSDDLPEDSRSMPLLTRTNEGGTYHVFALPAATWEAIRAASEPITVWDDLPDMLEHRGQGPTSACDLLTRLIKRGLVSFADVQSVIDEADAEDAAHDAARAAKDSTP